jgi:bifunctional non-homologous end joining protein LigD
MALDEYRRKRAANKTPEPFGGTELPASMGASTFVVQKHAARRLHYDFRLELGGVLLSWAVPKGPSLDPAVKRLAVQVEDHPVEYADFEGIIPAGNYGAGAVIVWDRGAWNPLEDPIAGLKKGHLVFELSGYKLHGVWMLLRTQGSDKEWLLIKKPDRWAMAEGQRLLPSQSVLSGLELEEIGAAPQRAQEVGAELARLGAKKKAVRADDVKLMLAETAPAPFSDAGWLFELKYDGYRLLIERHDGQIRMRYRSGIDSTHLFPDLARAVEALPFSFILDGEVVVLDAEGKPSFNDLQKRVQLSRPSDIARASLARPATFYAFDLIAFDGWDLRGLPLFQRKTVLQSILPRLGPLRFADHVEGEGAALYDEVRRRGLEGVMAKRADSHYRGGRSNTWLKVRSDHTGDFSVVGFSPSDRTSRVGFGALQVAVREGHEWIHVGGVGSGFDHDSLTQIRALLEPTVIVKAPVRAVKPLCPKSTRWVKPTLVAEVRFAQYTPDGTLRQPVFLRLRDDKKPEECVREDGDAEPGPEVELEHEPPPPPPPAEPERKVPFTNLGKVFWPDDRYTKGDLIEYYRLVSPSLLPYLADRPVVLTRYPDGITGKSFFQHNAPKFIPGWLRTERFWEEESGKETDYLVMDDLASLLYVANLGTIPIHAWSARAATIQRPDWCIIDLDPKSAPFSHVVELAQKLHALCDEIELPSFCKTSGQAGLHVLVPLGRAVTHEQSTTLAHLLARVIAEDAPDIATIERRVADRGGRVYLDFLQNGHGRTLVAPFSLRPVPGAPASTPLKWSEVGKKLDPKKFTLKTLPARLDKLGEDPLHEVLTLAPDLPAALEKLGQRLRPPTPKGKRR